MKTKELNNIIDEVLLESVKKRILTEQIEDNDFNKIQKLETILNFGDKVSVLEPLSENNMSGFYIKIDNITESEFINKCDANTIEEAESKLIKKIYYDMLVNKVGEKYDLDVDVTSDENLLTIEIKLLSGEKLDEDMKIENNKPKQDVEEQIDHQNLFDDNDECSCKKYKQYKMKELGYLHENKKRKLRLNENQLISLISNILKESIPGINVTKKAQDESKRETDQHMSSVDKKLKDYLSFEGNDNPEFPKQVGKGEKMTRKKTKEEEEYVETYRGGGMEDLNYDEEPSKEFIDRLKKSLDGDLDEEAGNVIKTDTGKEMFKKIDRKRKKIEKDPMYVKDPQPVQDVKTKKELQEDIEKMKRIYSYNKKTQ